MKQNAMKAVSGYMGHLFPLSFFLLLIIIGSAAGDGILQNDVIGTADPMIDTVTVSISNKAVPAGQVFTISVYVDENITPYSVLSFQFTMTFNPTLLSVRTVTAGSTFPESGQINFGTSDGKVYVAGASPDTLKGKGTIANIEFKVANTAQNGQTSILSFEKFQFNEPRIGPAVKIRNGLFLVGTYPDIDIAVMEHDFGKVSVGQTKKWNMTVTNKGWANLLIGGISSTSAEFVVSGTSFPLTIVPGENITVAVGFTPAQIGGRTGSLAVTSNDYFDSELHVSLSGAGVAPDIAVSNREYSFGQVTVGYSSSWEFRVYNAGNADLVIDSVLVYPDIFRVPSPVFPYTVGEGETLRVTTRFFPAELGQVAGVLTLFSNDPDERTVDLFLSGVGIPPEADIQMDAMSHDFGGVYLGTTAAWQMMITNVGTAPLNVASVLSDREEIEVTSPGFPTAINVGGSISARVAFHPLTEETVSGTLTITSDDPDETTVRVSMTGYGVAPSVLTVQGALGNPGSVAIQIPIGLEDQLDIASIEFVLSYPENILTPTAAIPTERSENLETFQVNLAYAAGKVKLMITGQTHVIGAGTGTIAKFACNVSPDAPAGDYPLTLSEVEAFDIYGKEVSFVLEDSIFAVRPVGVEDQTGEADGPRTYALIQNYPNPFNPTTTIRYQLSAVSNQATHRTPLVTLKIFNLLGQEVRTLVNETQSPGYYMIQWNGTDDSGRVVPSGVYLYRLEADRFIDSKKMILAR